MATILTAPQRRFLKLLLGLALFVLANSAYLFLSDPGTRLNTFYQLMLLGHLAGGALLLVLATIFLAWHLRRVRKLLRLPAVSTGVGLTLVAYLLFASGLFIIYEANSRDHRWIFRSHQVLALLAPAFYGLHRWVSHFPPRRRSLLTGGLAFAGVLLAMLGIHAATLPPPPPYVAVAPEVEDPFLPFRPRNYPDPSSVFAPANTTSDSGKFFPARLLTRGERGDQERIRAGLDEFGFAVNNPIGAETCRRCHPDVVAQWETSAHRFSSFNNPFYRAAIENMREEVGETKSQWCAGCHDPAIMLAGNMTKPIDPLTPESQAGLTCLACHAIDAIHGREGNGNYNVADEQPSPYLFDDESSGWKRFLADQMTKAKPAAHKAMFLKPVFRTAEFCLACHKVSLDVPLNGYRYLRGQDEYDAWHDSGVSHNAARTFYLPPKARNCQDCHMPLEEAPLGDVAAKDGKVRSHRFGAVNTALPHLRGDTETVQRIEAFLRDEKLRVDLFAVAYADGTKATALDRTQPLLVAGEEVIVEVVVRNQGVGHTFPGGTTDSNEAWVEFTLSDDAGGVVYRSGGVDERGHVDERAHFYRVVMVRHDGSEATRRDPHRFHVPVFRRLIGPGTADVARYGVTLPPELAGRRVRLHARLLWRKFNRRYTEFVFSRPGIRVPRHLAGDGVPRFPITTVAEDTVELAVATERAPLAIADDPSLWIRYNDHGIAHLLQGAYDDAERSFAEVARLRPDLPDGFRNQARRWIVSAAPERARPLLEKVDEVAPLDPHRPYWWGRFFERTEEYEAAADAYRASLEVFPEDRDGWRRLGGVYYKLHRYPESLAAYLKVLAIDPEDAVAHKRRLDIYRQLGRADAAAEAEKAFEKYRRDDEAAQLTQRFLLEHEEINHDAQPRHVHR